MTPLVSAAAGRHRARFHELEVSRVERLTEESVAVSFAVPAELAEEYAFEAGQHLTLRATIGGADVRRSYSVCLSPREARRRAEVRVASTTVEGGQMSAWLTTSVQAGDRLQVMTPLGGFTCPVRPAAARQHVAFAAGSGITPVLSLVTTFLEEEPESGVTLFFGNRRTSSVMFLEELADLKDRFPDRFQLVHVLSREPRESPLLSGRLDPGRVSALIDAFGVGGADEWFLCGPQGMVEGAQAVLAERGIGARHVHHEVFHVLGQQEAGRPVRAVGPAAPGARPEATLTVTLDGRTTTVVMPSREETILAATLRDRPDAPYSCTGGVCGTCRARVVAGEVRMDRNFALEADDLAAGVVLACQAHPVSGEVVLDYDA